MAASELRRTTGTVYGEIMRDSGISLPDGVSITGIDFASGLINGSVVARRSINEILKDLRHSTYYGLKDDRYTGTQIVRDTKVRHSEKTPYIFNPWKEIMGGDPIIHSRTFQYTDAYRIFGASLRTPKRITEKLRELYGLFVDLPQSMREKFLHELNCAPCDLDNTSALDLSFDQLSVYHKILNRVPSKRRDDAVDMLRLMSVHNICVDKGDIIRREIEHLMGFDVSTVPARWRSGHLDEDVLTEERVRELKGMLQRKKIRTS